MYDEIFTNTIFKKRFTAIVRPRGKNFIYQTGYVGCIFQKIHDFYFSEIHIWQFSLIKPLILGQKKWFWHFSFIFGHICAMTYWMLLFSATETFLFQSILRIQKTCAPTLRTCNLSNLYLTIRDKGWSVVAGFLNFEKKKC